MRKPIVAGNWKCHLTRPQARELIAALKPAVKSDAVEVVVCPAFTALDAAKQAAVGSKIGVGAQDVYWEPQGAFTGEVSVAMLEELGCDTCIIGHSERRSLFGESDAWVAKKLQALLTSTVRPIVCIGETLQEREAGRTLEVIERQLSGAFSAVAASAAARIVIAYEPVWAIGTGRTATPEQAQEAHAAIRQWLGKHWTAAAANQIRIQYGGSVKPENAAELMSQPDIDGALVGGASLNAASFSAIIQAAEAATTVA
jgi:triosephosphate isomerase